MTSLFIEPDWPAPNNVIALSTTRAGGTSQGPYSSLNLAHHVGDDDAPVARNRAVLGATLPAAAHVQWLSQVHGVQVVEASPGSQYPRADAAWSGSAGIACAVLTADCLPVLLCSDSGDRVAAAHAGWRGLVDGVLEAAVAALDIDPGRLLAWLGPAIGPGAFEVGAEVRDAFLAAARDTQAPAVAACFTPHRAHAEHYLADLYALARLRLRGAGVSRVYGGGLCTYSDATRFFSYRRDGQTGRMASLVLLRSS